MLELQAELPSLRQHEERAGHKSGVHEDSATAAFAGVRLALVTLCPAGWCLVAGGGVLREVAPLYRSVYRVGKTVDSILSRPADVSAAKAFLCRAMKGQRVPAKVTLVVSALSFREVASRKAYLMESGGLPQRAIFRSSKYVENWIEPDHRRIKPRFPPMQARKNFETAKAGISGIGLVEKIDKEQFEMGNLGGPNARMPEIWQDSLAA